MTAWDGDLDELGTKLMVLGSRFSRTIGLATQPKRSIVAHRVLANLQQEGPLRIGELTERERITQPAMTGAVQRLESEGLVRRMRDPEDARASLIEVTEQGVRELAAFRAQGAAVVRPFLEALPTQDLAALERAAELLEELSDALPRQ